ncbi:hypothetical protein BU24DRAFT_126580 [Aaosphaeria arxii CBS 175.79]|uniref:Secreted protein n=1 Tax=Aaosphaeria arxii CBS 175.79 TaxID=1450172 RepID=A0A6A5Y2S0_9PLEO|nr:uncharacterized protein BU24DRAFT_126580 [Aaosphaeria arxii CBS 175.79]KAF2019758.1 hypothetical protein BU24DRAFT_126580 [Aaosphaeria arxii CBS 175.79]
MFLFCFLLLIKGYISKSRKCSTCNDYAYDALWQNVSSDYAPCKTHLGVKSNPSQKPNHRISNESGGYVLRESFISVLGP